MACLKHHDSGNLYQGNGKVYNKAIKKSTRSSDTDELGNFMQLNAKNWKKEILAVK
mgnify:CR=1 FL=1